MGGTMRGYDKTFGPGCGGSGNASNGGLDPRGRLIIWSLFAHMGVGGAKLL